MTQFKEYVAIDYSDRPSRIVKARETKLYFISENGTRYKKVDGCKFIAIFISGDRWHRMRSYLYEKDSPLVAEHTDRLHRVKFVEKTKAELKKLSDGLTFEKATIIVDKLGLEI